MMTKQRLSQARPCCRRCERRMGAADPLPLQRGEVGFAQMCTVTVPHSLDWCGCGCRFVADIAAPCTVLYY